MLPQTLNEKGIINIKKYKNISTKNESPTVIGLVGPANNFAMGGMPMHLIQILLMEGHSLPQHLFLDVMVEKTQILVEFIKIHHVGLCLTANIGAHTATIQMYNTFTATITQPLQITITNLPDLENQLFQIYMEVHELVHQYLPDEEEDDEMTPLKDITDEES